MQQFGRRLKFVHLVLALGPLALAPQAAALDLCITCAGPEAHYNCRLEAPGANARDLRLQLMCISQIATEAGHESCAVDNPQPKACGGALKSVAVPDDVIAPPPPATPPAPKAETSTPPAPATDGQEATAAKAQETVVPKPAKPPKTMKEVVEKGAASTSKNLETAGGAVKDAANSAGGFFQKAGSAVGNAAKKTWTCVSSLFGEC